MDTHNSLAIQNLIDLNIKRRREVFLRPITVFPWLMPCTVKTLFVTDSILDFGDGDFGLSAFVTMMLNDAPFYVRFEVTLAHLLTNPPGATAMLPGVPAIANRITGFAFDNPAHFSAEMYDEIWMFGFETDFHNGGYGARSANPARYPADRLGDGELALISQHMDKGGGVFATGDHGALGRCLGGSVKRVRNMRHWQSFPSTGVDDEVGMRNAVRNDTNVVGLDPQTTFSDQSDDIPQKLELKLYSSWAGHLRARRWPHPILCGRQGRIDVFPDHPHEGECRVPPDLGLTYDDGTKEYPTSLDGSGQVVPEVIATSRVPAGNTADLNGSKTPTIAHTFGAISAYDGHKAGVGRVVCDSTWHHFVNVNLIGVVEGGIFDQFNLPGENPAKHDGFLSSPQGRAVLERIKNYYTNIGTWIAPPARIRCFHKRLWWSVIYKDRVMEAAVVDPSVKLDGIPLEDLLSIGIHARDVLGRFASQCQTLEWLIDWVSDIWPEVVLWINPWDPIVRKKRPQPPPLPVYDPQALLDVALGGAIVGMRQAFPFAPEALDEKMEARAGAAAIEGARHSLAFALNSSQKTFGEFRQILGAAEARLK